MRQCNLFYFHMKRTGFPCATLRETLKLSTVLHVYLLHRLLNKLDTNYGRHGYNLKCSGAFNAPTLTNLVNDSPFFTNISPTVFYSSGRKKKCTNYWKLFHFRRCVKHGFQLSYLHRTRHCSPALLEDILCLFHLYRSRNVESRGRNSCTFLRKCYCQ